MVGRQKGLSIPCKEVCSLPDTRINSSSKKVLILRALPKGADSRALRWGTIYADFSVHWGFWGTSSFEDKDERILSWRPRSGRFAFVLGYLAFVIMSFFYAFNRLRRGDILVCVDLETALLGFFAARLRRAKVHYDMADPFFLAKPVRCASFWKKIESWYMRHADLVTAPHRSRFQLFDTHLPDHARVVENVPTSFGVEDIVHLRSLREKSHVITLGYFGSLDYFRGIEDILSFVEDYPELRLLIGGRGVLQDLVIEAAKRCERIQFIGTYRPEDLGSLTRNVDVYCSLYYRGKPLHQFAAPNKYYEHLALGIPILISEGILNASDVRNNESGWVIEDGRNALDKWFRMVREDKNSIVRCSQKAIELWNTQYAIWLMEQRKFFANL
jgi:glycosyltransferase involved in cell wall biosynthesis